MQPRAKERRPWFTSTQGIMLVLLLMAVSTWAVAREPTALALRYGEFKQILNAPGVAFRNVKATRGEVRGEVVVRDRVSGLEAVDGRTPAEQARAYAWRTARGGLEQDP